MGTIQKYRMPLVSICIPNYNCADYLDHCFESVYNQTYPNIEVIFNDDQSTDESYEIALNWRRKFKEKGIFFKVGENKRSVGGDMNEKKVSISAEGEYSYILSGDNAINPTFIERCISILENNPNVGTVITHREKIDENGKKYQTAPFYNKDCIINGESQAAVFMSEDIATAGQRMVRRATLQRTRQFRRVWNVVGDWYDNFLFALGGGDVAYIKDPLFQCRLHAETEATESELNLLVAAEQYQLLNSFCALADAFDATKPQARYEEAVENLGNKCLRYALKMYQNKRNDVAYKYLLLAKVYKRDVSESRQYTSLIEMKGLYGSDLEGAIEHFVSENTFENVLSCEPPAEYQLISKDGRADARSSAGSVAHREEQ